MIKTKKIAISIPKEHFDSVEKIRKKLGMQRSAVIDKAICFWMKSLEEKEMINQYEEGYRKQPELLDDIDAIGKMVAEAFGEEGLA